MIAAAVLLSLLAPGCGNAGTGTSVPPLERVFVIIEENMGVDDVLGARVTEAPYLSALANAHVKHDAFYATTHPSLGNYIALVSGQIPAKLDGINCPIYPDCVRPGPTIAAQLDARGLSWRGYFESMPGPCARPTSNEIYRVGYATRHNPFVYFKEIVGDEGYCSQHVVPYEKAFAADLAAGPPHFSFIVPNTCNDGHDSGCNGDKSRLATLDAWLATNVPPILEYVNAHPRSALFITFDEAETADTAGCCNQPAKAGGHVALVMVAPGLENPEHRAAASANHYSLLRTLEDAFGLEPLGEAARVQPMLDLFAPRR